MWQWGKGFKTTRTKTKTWINWRNFPNRFRKNETKNELIEIKEIGEEIDGNNLKYETSKYDLRQCDLLVTIVIMVKLQ